MYRIYEVLQGFVEKSTPSAIDYKKSLTLSLPRVETFDHGRLINVVYNNAIGEKVLDVSIVYDDNTGDPLFPLSRVTTRKWYDVTGTNHGIIDFDVSLKLKKYNPRQVVSEGIRRRRNIVDSIFTSADALGYTLEASNYMKIHSDEILAYEVVHDTSIITTVTNDTATWLNDTPAEYGGVITMKQIIIGALIV